MSISIVMYVLIYILGCAIMHHVFDKAENELNEKNELNLESIPRWVWNSLKVGLILLSWIGLISMLTIGIIKNSQK